MAYDKHMDQFLSTLPARGATVTGGKYPAKAAVISIHAPREGSDCRRSASGPPRPISIHAPREGSDFCLPAPPSAW